MSKVSTKSYIWEQWAAELAAKKKKGVIPTRLSLDWAAARTVWRHRCSQVIRDIQRDVCRRPPKTCRDLTAITRNLELDYELYLEASTKRSRNSCDMTFFFFLFPPPSSVDLDKDFSRIKNHFAVFKRLLSAQEFLSANQLDRHEGGKCKRLMDFAAELALILSRISTPFSTKRSKDVKIGERTEGGQLKRARRVSWPLNHREEGGPTENHALEKLELAAMFSASLVMGR